MTQVLGDIAWMLELFAIAGGLVLLHSATLENRTKLLKAAGWLLIVGGLGTAVCTGYYWFSYQAQGHFNAVHRHDTMMMTTPEGSMAPGEHVGAAHQGAQP